MGRFITKKKIKVYKYQIYIGVVLIFILFIILINIIMNFILNKNFMNILVSNSFGNTISDYKMLSNKKDLFYRNIYGFKINDSSPVFKPNISNIVDSEPLIYLYNTYQTDKYKKDYYNSYSINPYVTNASFILQEYLKINGINAIVEDKSVAKTLKENNISYSNSYKGSRILLEESFKEYPSLNYFFDIGIFNNGSNNTTVKINNEEYATILFVVGCLNSNYEENKRLATSLNDRLNSYQGLSLGVSLRCGDGYHGVYNEDFHNNTLLIHVGSSSNTIDEVDRTLRVLARIIKEEIDGKEEKS